MADSTVLTAEEENRKADLRNRLCADRELNCAYVMAIFVDPRLIVYSPPSIAAPPSREREPNPYLTKRFGLLTPESLQRCKEFVEAHLRAFDAAYETYRVPKEIICGHLRIETNFGIPTALSPHPLGAIPAINRLFTLYVRKPKGEPADTRFIRRQTFAFHELKDLLRMASTNDWDLFQIPGSPTGAIGLVQFEPSSFNVAVDGDGDGKIDLFDPEDAVPSVAHYLVTRGWDSELSHQYRAIYAYYGGHYDSDRNKYYMRAVLKYAHEVKKYMDDHAIEPGLASSQLPHTSNLAPSESPDNRPHE